MQNFHKYLSVGDAEKAWGFYVNNVGYAKVSGCQSYPDKSGHPPSHLFTWDRGRVLNDYTLIFISKGKGVFESSVIPSIDIKEGYCFFLHPGTWHRYKPNPTYGWEEYWVGFKGPYPEMLMLNGSFGPATPVISAGFNQNLLDLFQRLIDTVKSGNAGYHQVITGITLEILAVINGVSKFKDETRNSTARLISKAKFLLQESIEQPLRLQEMVKQLPMGYSKFRKTFKQLTGVAPHQYYLDIRLNKAMALLINTELSINEIACLSGFKSSFYFSKFFKIKTGDAPFVYRAAKKNQ